MIKYIYNQMFYLQECGDFTWRVSDCKELVGEVAGVEPATQNCLQLYDIIRYN